MEEAHLTIVFFLAVGCLFAIFFLLRKRRLHGKGPRPFPSAWRDFLSQRVPFYIRLPPPDKKKFEDRVALFLETKKIEGIDTEINDHIRLMVACSAVIPTFAFDGYNYPGVRSILIYPNSFDKQFQTGRYEGHEQDIQGMVGNRFMNGIVILSRPDLAKAFDGRPHHEHVGIHEFVHLLDKEDGSIDGVPEVLMQPDDTEPWLEEVEKEMDRIRRGASDIDPYALTDTAEFLAVVSEYFFSDPATFRSRHPRLHDFLSAMYATRRDPPAGR